MVCPLQQADRRPRLPAPQAHPRRDAAPLELADPDLPQPPPPGRALHGIESRAPLPRPGRRLRGHVRRPHPRVAARQRALRLAHLLERKPLALRPTRRRLRRRPAPHEHGRRLHLGRPHAAGTQRLTGPLSLDLRSPLVAPRRRPALRHLQRLPARPLRALPLRLRRCRRDLDPARRRRHRPQWPAHGAHQRARRIRRCRRPAVLRNRRWPLRLSGRWSELVAGPPRSAPRSGPRPRHPGTGQRPRHRHPRPQHLGAGHRAVGGRTERRRGRPHNPPIRHAGRARMA